MTINKTTNGSQLSLAIVGRLDTTTAPKLEEELHQSIDGVTELVFDFAELEYISSAGLRVLLGAQKAMSKQGSMVLRNVGEVVMEIFEVTGFADILTIQ
jgi:anti-sigma B factor antagonist